MKLKKMKKTLNGIEHGVIKVKKKNKVHDINDAPDKWSEKEIVDSYKTADGFVLELEKGKCKKKDKDHLSDSVGESIEIMQKKLKNFDSVGTEDEEKKDDRNQHNKQQNQNRDRRNNNDRNRNVQTQREDVRRALSKAGVSEAEAQANDAIKDVKEAQAESRNQRQRNNRRQPKQETKDSEEE